MFLKPVQAAKFLGVSVAQVYAWMKSGLIPSIKHGRSARVVYKAQLVALVELWAHRTMKEHRKRTHETAKNLEDFASMKWIEEIRIAHEQMAKNAP